MGTTNGTAEREKMDEKVIGGASSHDVGWTVRCKKPRDVSSVAVASTGTGEASARVEAVVEGGKPWRPAAWWREAAAGSKEQFGGKPKEAAARVIGKSRWRVRLCIQLERREITESRSQSMGRPKMVLTVTSEPSAKERVMGEPDVST